MNNTERVGLHPIPGGEAPQYTVPASAIRDPVLWIAMVLVGGMLAGLNVARYMGYNAGMLDLGNMAQAIWSVTQGQPLTFTYYIGQMSRLSLHVETIYFLLAPLYALWPDPRLLLIIQALLFVLGSLPLFWLAMRHTGHLFVARCLVLIYLLYPTAQTSVLFDFHGDTLAIPLLLFTIDALDRRAWWQYALFAALTLSCKYYLALPVAGIGAYALLWGGQRRAGVLTVVAAMLYGVLTFFVIRPMFSTAAQGGAAEVSVNYIAFYFGSLQDMVATLDERLLNAIIVFGPVMLLAWRGWRWLLPGLPVAIAALISTGPGAAYDYRYHHYAIVVPFILMATLQGVQVRLHQAAQQKAAATRPRARRSWRGDLGLTMAVVVIFSVLLVDTPLNPFFWMGLPGQGLDASAYGITQRDAMKNRFLRDHVPPDASIAASIFLAPHIVNRETLYTVRYPHDPGGEIMPTILPDVDYVVADALFDYRVIVDGNVSAGAPYETAEIAQVLWDPAFDLVAARDGLVLFQRDAAPEDVLLQEPPQVLPGTRPASHTFSGTIGLTDARIISLNRNRFRATFEWSVLDTPGSYIAVSRLEGVAQARIVHLPTYVLLPTHAWEPGTLVRETFDVELPAEIEPGRYTWRVGWYTLQHVDAYTTDARSRLPHSQEVVVGEIEVNS